MVPNRTVLRKVSGVTQDSTSKSIGAKVSAERARAGLSRKRLAALANVSERYLHQLENGEANPSVGILMRLAQALDFAVGDLFPNTSGGAPSSAQRDGHANVAPWTALTSSMSLQEQRAAVPVLDQFLKDRRRAHRGIALLGLRGAGKSTLGQLYSKRHNLPFISITREIETRAGMTLDDLFNLGGADAYRTLENDVAGDICRRRDRIVLETAGGIAGNNDALDVILASFKTIWLKATPAEHLARVASQGDTRPTQGNARALDQLKSLLAQRETEYARAEFTIDTSGRTPQDCLAELEAITAPFLQG